MQVFACWVCLQVPAPSQVSSVHESPSLVQAVPLALLVHAVVDVPLAQLWQTLRGLSPPFE
jgi:hypothetical protein